MNKEPLMSAKKWINTLSLEERIILRDKYNLKYLVNLDYNCEFIYNIEKNYNRNDGRFRK